MEDVGEMETSLTALDNVRKCVKEVGMKKAKEPKESFNHRTRQVLATLPPLCLDPAASS